MAQGGRVAAGPDPYPCLLLLTAIVLFAVGLSPAIQAIGYGTSATAVLATIVVLPVGRPEVSSPTRC